MVLSLLALSHPAWAADPLAAQRKQVDALKAAHRYPEAETAARQMIAAAEALSSQDRPAQIALGYNYLGHVYLAWGHWADAEAAFKRALALNEEALGPDHLRVAITADNLAQAYRFQKRFDEAEPLYARAIKIAEKASPQGIETANILDHFSFLKEHEGKLAEAVELCQRALAIREKVSGADNQLVTPTLIRLGELYTAQRRYDHAEQTLKRALAIREKASPGGNAAVAEVLERPSRMRTSGRIARATRNRW